MKKTICLLLAILTATLVLNGCQGSQTKTATAVDIRIGGLKGPTSIGMVQLMESAAQGKAANRYTFTVAGSADEITPKLVKGELDVAAVPANLASVLYNNTNGQFKLLAINTLGVIYLVEDGNTVNTFDDLRGKTIYATGKGSTPEYALRYLLQQNEIDPDRDVRIEWKSEPTEVVALLSQTKGGVAMLPQPYVVVAQDRLPDLRMAIDLNAVWDSLDNGSLLITGVIVARRDFVDKYPAQIDAFLNEYQVSTEYANSEIPQAALLVEKYGIFKASIAEKAIPFCNITYMDGAEMKTAMEGYLNVLFAQNPKSVGGKLPDKDFYYEG